MPQYRHVFVYVGPVKHLLAAVREWIRLNTH